MWRLTSFEVSNPALQWVHFAGQVWDFLWRLRVKILALGVLWIGRLLTDTHVYAQKSSCNPEIRIRSGLLRLKLVLMVISLLQGQILMGCWGCPLQALVVGDLMNLHCWGHFDSMYLNHLLQQQNLFHVFPMIEFAKASRWSIHGLHRILASGCLSDSRRGYVQAQSVSRFDEGRFHFLLEVLLEELFPRQEEQRKQQPAKPPE